MLNTILNGSKHVCHVANKQTSSRHFYKWLIIMFNGINKKRIEEVGPDRACAEWLLRNGASVQWKGMKEYLTNYNLLPKEEERFYLSGVDATDSAIHHIGFPHFSGCKYIEDIKLVRCSYIENDAIPLLSIVKDSLKHLEVVECKNVTDEALLHLKNLVNLKTLKLGGMPYVENKDNVVSKLTAALPNCKISYMD
ncbi:ATP synthase subunit s, mitochondrial [Nasonia vitripennis]|uniref:Mitochondrial ATP synthase regulatory component factor B n=1 Tax=Nasonia vitripennis TaxID=7425 RepID=A0A7M7LJD5_NASVI|nr:ATP synthase subunit s, mitochondrial [Nasonia vitripennis]